MQLGIIGNGLSRSPVAMSANAYHCYSTRSLTNIYKSLVGQRLAGFVLEVFFDTSD